MDINLEQNKDIHPGYKTDVEGTVTLVVNEDCVSYYRDKRRDGKLSARVCIPARPILGVQLTTVVYNPRNRINDVRSDKNQLIGYKIIFDKNWKLYSSRVDSNKFVTADELNTLLNKYEKTVDNRIAGQQDFEMKIRDIIDARVKSRDEKIKETLSEVNGESKIKEEYFEKDVDLDDDDIFDK